MASQDEIDALAHRLRELVRLKGGNQAVSDRADIPLSTLNTYLSGRAEPKITVFRRLAATLGVSVDQLLDLGSHTLAAGTQPGDPDTCSIPLLDITASAGPGAENADVEIVGHVPFSRAELRRLGVSPDEAHAIRSRGDSMEPTIADGALVLINRRVRRVRDDGIYAIVVDGDARLKRVQKRVDGGLVLTSDNDRYNQEVLGPGSAERLIVEGRAFWSGGKL